MSKRANCPELVNGKSCRIAHPNNLLQFTPNSGDCYVAGNDRPSVKSFRYALDLPDLNQLIWAQE